MMTEEEQTYFFPKENPPVTIKAKSMSEARRKLEQLKAKNT